MISWLGIPFERLDGSINESPLQGENPQEHVLRVAEEKARSATRELEGNWIVISADTVVVDKGLILGKPMDAEDAARMLEQLGGGVHSVDTGLIIYNLKDRSFNRVLCESQVRMRAFTAEEVLDYVRSGDPLDKAGAYAIQNRDFNPVQDFTGCMANVMGLPLCHLVRELRPLGIPLNLDLTGLCREKLAYDCPVSDQILAGENVG
jgi:septum formation protein